MAVACHLHSGASVRFLAMCRFLLPGRDLLKLGVYEPVKEPGTRSICPAPGAVNPCESRGLGTQNHPTTDVIAVDRTPGLGTDDRRRIQPRVSLPEESALAARPVNGQRQAHG
jgi:hypothetical protein